MRKKLAFVTVGMMMLCAVTACGKTKSQYLAVDDYTKYVKLCEYEGVEAEKVTFEVSEDEIQEEIDMQLYDYVEYEDVKDRGIEMGDYVVLDYEGTIDGKVNEKYCGSEEEIVVGEEFFFPKVEEALVGMKKGEEKTVTFELAEEWAEEGDVGKQLSVKVTVGAVTVEKVPELTEEFVKENMDYDSIEALKKAKKEELVESKTEEYKNSAISDIMDYLVTNSKFDGYPDELYKECEEYFNAENENNAAMFGMELKEYLDFMGMDEKACKESIEESVHFELVVGAVAEKEGIDCTKSEIEKFAEDVYEEYGFESAKDFMEEYTEQQIGYQIIYEKVLDYLYEKAKLVEIDEKTYLERMRASEEANSDDESAVDDESLDGEATIDLDSNELNQLMDDEAADTDVNNEENE